MFYELSYFKISAKRSRVFSHFCLHWPASTIANHTGSTSLARERNSGKPPSRIPLAAAALHAAELYP